MRLCQSFQHGGIIRRKVLVVWHEFVTISQHLLLQWISPGEPALDRASASIMDGDSSYRNVQPLEKLHRLPWGNDCRKIRLPKTTNGFASYPVIEDEVWIGPHAVVIGGVRLGRGSRIAAGTVVTSDVQPHAIVGGNPMRILAKDAECDVSKPALLADQD